MDMNMNKYEQTYLRYSLSDVSNLNNISGSLLNNISNNSSSNGGNNNNNNSSSNNGGGNSFYNQQSQMNTGSIGSIGSIGSNSLISGSSPPNFRTVLSPSSTPSSSLNNVVGSNGLSSSSLLNNLVGSGGGSGGGSGNWGSSFLSTNNSFNSSFNNNNNINNSSGSGIDPFSIQLSPSPSSNQVIFNNIHQPTTITKPSIKSTGFNLNTSHSNNINGGNNNNINNSGSNISISKSPLSNSGGNPSQSTSSVSLLTSPSFPSYGSSSNANNSSFKDFSIGVDALSPLSDERLPGRYGNDHDASLKSKWYQSQQPFDYTIVSTGGSGYHSENNSFRSQNSGGGSSPNLNGFAYGSAPSTTTSSSFPEHQLHSNNNNNNSNSNNINGKINSPGSSLPNNLGSNNGNGNGSGKLLEYQIHDNHQKQQLIQMQLQQLQLQQQQLQFQQQQFQLKQQHHHHQHQQQHVQSNSSSITSSPLLSSNSIGGSPFFKHQTLNNTVTTYNPLDTSSLIQSSYDTVFDLNGNSNNINTNIINNNNNNDDELKLIQSISPSFNSTPNLQPQSPRNLIGNQNLNSISQPTTPRQQSLPQSPSSSTNNLKKESFIVSFKDTPSRNLFVRNVNPIVEDDDLYTMFQSYGPVKHIYCNCKSRGFVIVSYFDIRHATQAFKNLQNNELHKKKIKIHYCISKDYSDQGTLVVFNLDSSITNQDLTQLFGTYGQIKEIRETPNKTHHKFIEYYDIRHASDAIKHLNKIELCGKKLRIQHSRPGGFNKNLFPNDQPNNNNMNNNQTIDYSTVDDSSVSTNFLDDDIINSAGNNGSVGKKKSKNGQSTPNGSGSFIDQSSFNDMMDENELNEMMDKYMNCSENGSRSQTPISDHMLMNSSPPTNTNNTNNSKLLLGQSPSISQPHSPINSPSSSTSSTPTIPSRFSKPIIPLLVGLTSLDQDISTNSPPLSPLSPLSKSIKSPRSSNDKLINSPRTNSSSNNNINNNSKENLEDKIQYNFNLEDVKLGLDSRTSIMIKNIPNRLSQTILLSIVDEHFKGAYDFLYLPIDPHTKVNYGYAFINFINYKHIVPFYLEFNSRKWEKFYCSKVCEITYARIQGKIALIQHLRNTSLGSHNKKISPIVFVSDISGSGEKPLHLATFSVDVFM